MASRCAIWARVSTDEQESGNQLAELRQWAARRGLEVAAEYVLDGASAWKAEHREQLGQALADARVGRYDVLLCWALDRLSREGSRPRSACCAASTKPGPRCCRCGNRGPRALTRTWLSFSVRSTRGWRARSQPAAASGCGRGWPGGRPRACRSGASRARRTAGSGSGQGTSRPGSRGANVASKNAQMRPP